MRRMLAGGGDSCTNASAVGGLLGAAVACWGWLRRHPRMEQKPTPPHLTARCPPTPPPNPTAHPAPPCPCLPRHLNKEGQNTREDVGSLFLDRRPILRQFGESVWGFCQEIVCDVRPTWVDARPWMGSARYIQGMLDRSLRTCVAHVCRCSAMVGGVGHLAARE